MDLSVGAIVEGKVTGITKFGAFVSLPGGGSGLVHISEIANAFVNDVHDYLTEGQTVQVKVLSITETGKVNLSIKQTLPPAPRPAAPLQRAPSFRPQAPRPAAQGASPRPGGSPRAWSPADQGAVHGPSGDASFEDKLKHFMQDSDSRINDSKLYADRKNTPRRRK